MSTYVSTNNYSWSTSYDLGGKQMTEDDEGAYHKLVRELTKLFYKLME